MRSRELCELKMGPLFKKNPVSLMSWLNSNNTIIDSYQKMMKAWLLLSINFSFVSKLICLWIHYTLTPAGHLTTTIIYTIIRIRNAMQLAGGLNILIMDLSQDKLTRYLYCQHLCYYIVSANLPTMSCRLSHRVLKLSDILTCY